MFGQHANRIVTLANGLRVINTEKYKGRRLGLSAQWTKWFLEWFDAEDYPGVMLLNDWDAIQANAKLSSIHGCREHFVAKDLYYRFSMNKPNHILFDLKPKRIFWKAARKMYNVENMVTVHRQWHPECVNRDAVRISNFCTHNIQPFLTHQACRWNEKDLRQQLLLDYPNDPLSSQRPIVSCSDNSWFSSVNAFTVEDTHEFHLQMVLMSLSYIHYGNPASSIDYVIAHWRDEEVKGKRVESVMPEACFIGYQRKYRKDWLDEDHLQKTVHKMNVN